MLEKWNRRINNYNHHASQWLVKLTVLSVISSVGLSMCHHIKGTPESELSLAIADRLKKAGYSDLADGIILKPNAAETMANSVCKAMNGGVPLSTLVDKLEEKWTDDAPENLGLIEPVVIEGVKARCPAHLNQVQEMFPDAYIL